MQWNFKGKKTHNPHWELTQVKGIRGQHETRKNFLTSIGFTPATSTLEHCREFFGFYCTCVSYESSWGHSNAYSSWEKSPAPALSDSPAAADLYTCVKRFIIKYGICFMLSGVFCVSGLVQCLGISLMCLDWGACMHWCWVKIMVCTFYLNGVVKSFPYIAYKRH